jgi:arsenite methyltransferase
MREDEIRKHVRDRYATAARQGASCGQTAGCCGGGLGPDSLSKRAGYSDEDLKTVPEGANLGLGCGNPLALASLREGETVLDLGSGGGFDCFLAARQVGHNGKVIGVDMTPEMLERARGNARKGDYGNVEFRLGEIENLPVADNQADIVISNCVINLSPAKERVFQEAFRALKPGGRLMVSDIVLRKDLPEEIRNSILVYTACVAGATRKEKYLDAIRAAGFEEVQVLQETVFPVEMAASDPAVMEIVKTLGSHEKIQELAGSVASVKVFARKPAAAGQQAMNG